MAPRARRATGTAAREEDVASGEASTWGRGLIAFILIVGAVAAGAAAVLVALVFEGLTEALIVLAAIAFVQQVESNVFEPVIVDRSVNVDPVAILLAVTVGLTIGGIGALVARAGARRRLDDPPIPTRARRRQNATSELRDAGEDGC